MPTETVKLRPYVFFYGRCEEALGFYKKAFGGDYEVQRYEGTPMAEDVPAEFLHKVMHASFTAPGVAFFCSDGSGPKAIDPDEGNISLSLSTTDNADGERLFAALSDGGDVKMPLHEPSFGGRFGVFVDRFGIEWMMWIE